MQEMERVYRRPQLGPAGIYAALSLQFAGCQTPQSPPPLPPVRTAVVEKRDIPQNFEWLATLDGSTNAEIRPRVEGHIESVNYQEGSVVETGALHGISVRKVTASPLIVVALYSPGGSYDNRFLANYATINLIDELLRVPGVGDVRVLGGADYAMRIWVNPDRLANLGLSFSDLFRAVQRQSTVNPAGQLGAEPAPKGQQFTFAIRAEGRLFTPEQFGEIIVRAKPDGSLVRLKDVARIDFWLS